MVGSSGTKNSYLCLPLLMLLPSVRATPVGCHLSCWHSKGLHKFLNAVSPIYGWGLSVHSLTVNYNLESFSPREIVVYNVYTFRFREP